VRSASAAIGGAFASAWQSDPPEPLAPRAVVASAVDWRAGRAYVALSLTPSGSPRGRRLLGLRGPACRGCSRARPWTPRFLSSPRRLREWHSLRTVRSESKRPFWPSTERGKMVSAGVGVLLLHPRRPLSPS
jgi:hypothetical protein